MFDFVVILFLIAIPFLLGYMMSFVAFHISLYSNGVYDKNEPKPWTIGDWVYDIKLKTYFSVFLIFVIMFIDVGNLTFMSIYLSGYIFRFLMVDIPFIDKHIKEFNRRKEHDFKKFQ